MYQNQQQPEEERKPVEKKVYSYNDLLEFKNPQVYSSIGKMQLSQRQTAPSFGFGTSSRAKQAKVYQDEALSRTQFVGKTSPGPNYEVRHTDKYYYKDDPKWSFGKDVRNTLNTGAKHAYYTRQDIDFDPITADNTRRWESGKVKIGLESRFSDGPKKHKATPGPDYNPSLKPEIPTPPHYSFGVRREIKGASPLVLMASTPQQVGPGSYLKLEQGNTSTMKDHPKVGFTKELKFRGVGQSYQRNQTYDTRSSVGGQIASRNRTMPEVSMGKAKKDAYTGHFKDMMATQPTKIRIQHAKY
jgi:hypothetical protein